MSGRELLAPSPSQLGHDLLFPEPIPSQASLLSLHAVFSNLNWRFIQPSLSPVKRHGRKIEMHFIFLKCLDVNKVNVAKDEDLLFS